MKSILLIEDDAIIGESLMQRFEIEGMHVTWCRRLAEATLALERLPGAVVSDVRLPDGIATQWFTQLSVEQKSLPWFFLTGYGSVGEAIEAIRAGAREYLTKPFDIEALVGLVQRALHQQIQEDDEAVLGVSPAMRRAEATIRKVASQKVSVLLTGESGVGKEVAARLLHDSSPAHGAAEFVAVNCAAIPESMMEAEFLATRREPSQEQCAHTRAILNAPTREHCFWTNLVSCQQQCRPSFFGHCRKNAFSDLARKELPRANFASLRPPTGTSMPR